MQEKDTARKSNKPLRIWRKAVMNSKSCSHFTLKFLCMIPEQWYKKGKAVLIFQAFLQLIFKRDIDNHQVILGLLDYLIMQIKPIKIVETKEYLKQYKDFFKNHLEKIFENIFKFYDERSKLVACKILKNWRKYKVYDEKILDKLRIIGHRFYTFPVQYK